MSAQPHGTEGEGRFPPHIPSPRAREVCTNQPLRAGNRDSAGPEKIRTLTTKFYTDLHAVLDSGCLVIFTIPHVYYWSVYSWRKVVPDGPATTESANQQDIS